MKKIYLLIAIMILPIQAFSNSLVIDVFNTILSQGVKESAQREIEHKKLKSLSDISTSFSSCTAVVSANKMVFEAKARSILKSLRTVDDRTKYFDIYLSSQILFENRKIKCAQIAQKRLDQ